MAFQSLTPAHRLGLTVLFSFLVTGATLFGALSLDDYRIRPVVGALIKSSAGEMVLNAQDLVTEPSDLRRPEPLETFYQRQSRLENILQGSNPVMILNGNESPLYKKTRGLRDLSALFWIPLIVGLLSFFVGGWILSLKPRNIAVQLFALSGLSMCISAATSAIYTTRPWYISEEVFRVLQILNAGGACFFSIFILGLFLYYPRRLPHWKILFVAEAVFLAGWMLLIELGGPVPSAGYGVLVSVAMVLICTALAFQFWNTRSYPVERAILQWLGMSVVFGAGLVLIFNIVPVILGIAALDQGYAFIFFLIIYLGVVAGLLRFRLFDVGRWSLQFLLYGGAIAILILLDLTLITFLGFQKNTAWGVTTLLLAFVYFPMRDFWARRIHLRRERDVQDFTLETLEIALSPNLGEMEKQWLQLLTRIFKPLEVAFAPHTSSSLQIVDDGLGLLIPTIGSLPSVRVSYPQGGKGLFGSESLRIMSRLMIFLTHAESTREAHKRGAREERFRMAQDLHDDLSSRLMWGLDMADERMKPTLHGALEDIRTIVGSFSGEDQKVEDFLADIRHEAAERVETAKLNLEWSWGLPPLPDHYLNYRVLKNVRSTVREIINNSLKHARAKTIKVTMHQHGSEHLILTLSDDGKGFDVLNRRAGFGLASVKKRLKDVQGEFEIKSSGQGTQARIIFPVLMNKGTMP